ncbi:MAG: cation diffusion facilitator family transporter [Gammaproteobacteria bacterium]
MTGKQQHTGNLQRAASYASLSVALFLVAAKIWAWLATQSVSLLSSLVDSFLDVLASGVTVIAISIAMQPADREHRFGHGKAEGMAALIQAVIISLSALFVLSEALPRFWEPQPIREPETGIAVMLLSIFLTLLLLAFQRSVIRKTGSIAISADALHYRSDLFINLSVVIAIPLTAWTNLTLIDPLIATAIAFYILRSTWEIGSGALDVLLDRELPEAERSKIKSIASAHPKVLGFHDLRTRSGGHHYIFQFHLELDPKTSLLNTHMIMDQIEDEIRAAYPGCEIIVHADPQGLEEPRDHFD